MALSERETVWAVEALAVAAEFYRRDGREEASLACRRMAHVLREGGALEGQAA
jgi:hypothetical protein